MNKIYAWRQGSTGKIIVTHGRTRFEAAEALGNEFPECEADDFTMLAEGNEEFLENVLLEMYGGIALMVDTTEMWD